MNSKIGLLITLKIKKGTIIMVISRRLITRINLSTRLWAEEVEAIIEISTTMRTLTQISKRSSEMMIHIATDLQSPILEMINPTIINNTIRRRITHFRVTERVELHQIDLRRTDTAARNNSASTTLNFLQISTLSPQARLRYLSLFLKIYQLQSLLKRRNLKKNHRGRAILLSKMWI